MAGKASLEFNHFDEMAASLERDVPYIVMATALNVMTSAQEKMARPKHGRTYKIGDLRAYLKEGGRNWNMMRSMGVRVKANDKGRKYLVVGAKLHRASAPGEAPAVDTGKLRNSASVKMAGKNAAELSFTAGYAAVLEFGGAHMAPRPFVQPSVDEERPAFERAIQDLFK